VSPEGWPPRRQRRCSHVQAHLEGRQC
jgi:hypothetical protein